MTIDMTRFYQVFFDEAEEHLAAMERLLLDNLSAFLERGEMLTPV